MGIVVFICSVHERVEGHLGIACILGMEDILYLGDHRSFVYWIFSQDELQRSHELWNNAFIFMLLGFLYLSGGSIWVNALPDTLLKSNQPSLP